MSIISLLGSLFSNGVNYMLNERNNAHNKEIMQMQNTFNRQMQQEQNAYNDPAAQMARLKAAGINPALAYSNGVANTATSLPQAGGTIPMQAFRSDLGELGNRMSLDKMRGVQNSESESRIRLNDHTILKFDSEIDKNNAETNVFKSTVSKLGSDIQKNNAEIDYLRAKAKNEGLNSISKEIDNWIAEATKHDKVLASSLANEKTRKEINYIMQMIAVGKSEVRLNDAKTKWTDKDIERISEDIRKAKFWNDLNDESRAYLLENIRISRDNNETTFQINLEHLIKTRAYNNAYGKLDNFFTICDKFMTSLSPFD